MVTPRTLTQRGGQDISILDIGHGLFSSAKEKEALTIDDIQCIPLWAFIWGMDKADKELIPRFAPKLLNESTSARQNYTFLSHMRSSHAILSGDYLYFSIYFGQHLFVLDADCSEKDNTVSLYYKDSSQDYSERLNHISLFSQMLESAGFEVNKRYDSLEAYISGVDDRTLRIKLVGIGRLCSIIQLMNMNVLQDNELKKLARFPDERRTELKESLYG